MIIDGRGLAKVIAEDVRRGVAKCKQPPVLGIFAVAPTKEIQSFIRIKKRQAEQLGIRVREETHSALSQEQAENLLKSLVEECDGVVLQKPLPRELNEAKLLTLIPKEKDVDGLREDSPYMSPVAQAVRIVLHTYQVRVQGAKAVVVGSGKLVGMPVADMLEKQGASVVVFDKDTGIDHSAMHAADIIVSGVGKEGIITSDMVSAKTVLIDAGTSESQGAVVGDVHKDCYEKVRLISPVPGGIGPITVVELFKNLLKSASCSL